MVHRRGSSEAGSAAGPAKHAARKVGMVGGGRDAHLALESHSFPPAQSIGSIGVRQRVDPDKLKVTTDRSEEHFCVACALEIIARDQAKLLDLEQMVCPGRATLFDPVPHRGDCRRYLL